MSLLRALFGRSAGGKRRLTRVRRESNAWLRRHAAGITGRTLSIGSADDEDGEGGHYRDYFTDCTGWVTSELTPEYGCDLVLDVRSMPQIRDGAFDCVFCSAVLEHVDDFHSAVNEITRILKPGGILLLGLPFRQPIHLAPSDYWRFTEHGIRYLLRDRYEILELAALDTSVPRFPATYWVKAKKGTSPFPA